MAEKIRQFTIKWLDGGRSPQVAPNPRYPCGVDLDISAGRVDGCTAELPYPAKRIGSYVVTCLRCGFVGACTTAGRPDDPRSLTMPCKMMEAK